MQLTMKNKVGKAAGVSLKMYKTNPWDLNVATNYAFTLAFKRKERMIVVQGNSYMQKVYHICKETDDVVTYNGGVRQPTTVVVVETNGDVYYAEAI